jgi:hypothetical protein
MPNGLTNIPDRPRPRSDGTVTGWTGWLGIPGWHSWDNPGGDVATARLEGRRPAA